MPRSPSARIKVTLQLAGLASLVFGLAHLSKGAHEGREYQRLVGPVIEDMIAKDKYLQNNELSTNLTLEQVTSLQLGQARFQSNQLLAPWVCFLLILAGTAFITLARDRSTKASFSSSKN